jgi:uncharacterized protein (TIGR00255 family)
MIRSMTGFGEAERSTPAGMLRVELRTVNHRYLNVNARLPSSLLAWESHLREWLRGPFQRGHVNCTLRLEVASEGAPSSIRLDEEKAAAYLRVLRQMGERFDLPGSPDLAMLARFGDVIGRDETEDAVPVDEADLKEVVHQAALRTVEMREEEGKRLEVDLRDRVAAIERALADVERLAPERLVSERDRVRRVIADLVEGRVVDEARLAQEVAHLAERLDVSEEVVRFRSHLELFVQLLDAQSHEAVGKRLGFLVQEMHREANTIGSKANDADIAHRVVSIKDEVERLREQVENVE